MGEEEEEETLLLRQRKNRSKDDSSKAKKDEFRKRGSSESIDKTFTNLILGTFFLLSVGFGVFFQFYPGSGIVRDGFDAVLDGLGLDLNQRLHAVVIDAGSTGSRVLGFSFRRNFLTGDLRLDNELWVQDKPGLSSHAENPSAAAQSIVRLLNEAKKKIPEAEWSQTPVTLKATAGLRLLPAHQSDAIIRAVRTVLVESGFKTSNETAVEIMNPMEEGLFAWFTVNFLLETFGDYASLDLGGGSTQITFAPKKPVSGLENRKHFLHNVTVFGKSIQVYSHSYLGLGLMVAREAVFSGESENKSSTPCFSSKESRTWSFHGKEYLVTGDGASSYENCLRTIRNRVTLKDDVVHIPTELTDHRISAFSYFFDRAFDRALISGTDGVVKVQDYADEAVKACSEKDEVNEEDERDSFYDCFDLTFISSLLADGYGLPPSKEITLFKKINGHEASWALGVAYDILEN